MISASRFAVRTPPFALRRPPFLNPHFVVRLFSIRTSLSAFSQSALRTSYFAVDYPTFYRVTHFVLRTSRLTAQLSTALRTSYFVLRGSPPNLLLRCALRGSHFAVRTSRFALRGSRPSVTGGLHFAVHIQSITRGCYAHAQ